MKYLAVLRVFFVAFVDRYKCDITSGSWGFRMQKKARLYTQVLADYFTLSEILTLETESADLLRSDLTGCAT